MIASLMMYARPELVGAHDRYWALIRGNLEQAGIASPEKLSQDADEFEVWKHPDLVLSQTCGMPYRIWLHDKVTLVGTPDYGVEGCSPGYYRSPFVVRAEDPRHSLNDFKDAVFAFNQTFSQSGYGAPFARLKPHGFWFERRVQTEQHLKSAQAVADGTADIAALDVVSWRLMQQYETFARDLRVLDWTDASPGLPLITAKGNDADAVFAAVERAINDLNEVDRNALGLRGIARISKDDYLSVPNPDAQ